MIIIWGTKSRQEHLGAVAEWCPNCRKVEAFSVSHYFRVSHIYYIPLGRGTRTATVRECWECQAQYYCKEEDYDAFVPEKEAEQMSLRTMLQRTNSALLQELQNQSQQNAEAVDEVLPADDRIKG